VVGGTLVAIQKAFDHIVSDMRHCYGNQQHAPTARRSVAISI